MTKKEIVKTISDKTGLTQLQIKEIVQLTFDGIIETLLSEGRVELRNFGVFQVKSRKARKARNPRTGLQVDVPEKFVVTFKPGKEMEAQVQKLEDEAKLVARSEGNGPAKSNRSEETPVPFSNDASGPSEVEENGESNRNS
ncbi:MAG: HU family DNA-binding protein [Aureliella sp.]